MEHRAPVTGLHFEKWITERPSSFAYSLYLVPPEIIRYPELGAGHEDAHFCSTKSNLRLAMALEIIHISASICRAFYAVGDCDVQMA
jgi:hypothetical protein